MANPDPVNSTVKLEAGGGNVFCAVGSNPRTRTVITITKFPLPSGSPVTVADQIDADPTDRLALGDQADLSKKAIIQCDGDIIRNPASGDSTYMEVLRFYQGSTKVGESDPVKGDFGGENTVRFKIVVTLK